MKSARFTTRNYYGNRMTPPREEFRVERDTLGEVQVPTEALWGARTQRAREAFRISGLRPYPAFVRAVVLIKKAAAYANAEAGRLTNERRDAIVRACDEILAGKHQDQFVIDPFQAGAGVSHHMNVNEVIANRANEILGHPRGSYAAVTAEDHVNMAQSTNDVMPTAIRLAGLEMSRSLVREVQLLADAFGAKGEEFKNVVKPGRTHLQDAVPMTLGQEFGGYGEVLRECARDVAEARESSREIGIGGTAAGTGLNADPDYRFRVTRYLSDWIAEPLEPAKDLFAAMQSLAPAVELSAALRGTSIELSKIANDLRLLVSGPRTGLGEIYLPVIQPGSSIMPGKVNPVMPEMVNAVCFQVIGNDTALAWAAQAGQLELNVMMPEVAFALCFSLDILTNAARIFREKCVVGIHADAERAEWWVQRSPALLATALSPHIGYKKSAELAKEALATNRTLFEVALEHKVMPEADLRRVLDPLPMTKGGVQE
jgi:aspartate ammonia-lyase